MWITIIFSLNEVASTTWSWYLLRAAGISDSAIRSHDNVHVLLQKELPPPNKDEGKQQNYEDSLKLVASRHPYERLVSAYQVSFYLVAYKKNDECHYI